MAHQPKHNLWTWLGFVIWGDLGPFTLYKDKQGKLVAFPKTWPDKPASPAQQVQRDKFRAAAIAWASLPPSSREQWELASRRASLCMHGYDLWVHWSLIGDDSTIQTLERQTGTTLLPP